MSIEHSPTRRDFLTRIPAAAGNCAGDADRDLARGASAGTGEDGYLLTVSRRAMACDFSVHLNATAGAMAVESALAALDRVERLEDQLTVYRETSEVIEINRRASSGPVVVEDQLFELIRRAIGISGETDGAFDITSGPLSEVWGFVRRQGRLPSVDQIRSALDRVGFWHIELDRAKKTVFFDRPGIAVQLNGIGKGYALDRAAAVLDVPDFIFHGGQSSVVARGRNSTRAGGGWSVGVRHPLRLSERLGEMVLRDTALGTSGSATQSFVARGRRWGHILDPRSGYPAEGVLSATVIAPSAAKADALATALYILGPEGAAKYCEIDSEVAALLVCPGEAAGQISLHEFNLSPEVWHAY